MSYLKLREWQWQIDSLNRFLIELSTLCAESQTAHCGYCSSQTSLASCLQASTSATGMFMFSQMSYAGCRCSTLICSHLSRRAHSYISKLDCSLFLFMHWFLISGSFLCCS